MRHASCEAAAAVRAAPTPSHFDQRTRAAAIFAQLPMVRASVTAIAFSRCDTARRGPRRGSTYRSSACSQHAALGARAADRHTHCIRPTLSVAMAARQQRGAQHWLALWLAHLLAARKHVGQLPEAAADSFVRRHGRCGPAWPCTATLYGAAAACWPLQPSGSTHGATSPLMAIHTCQLMPALPAEAGLAAASAVPAAPPANTCPDLAAPVCGADGVTYYNSCLAKLQKVEVEHTGYCPGAAGGSSSSGQYACSSPRKRGVLTLLHARRCCCRHHQIHSSALMPPPQRCASARRRRQRADCRRGWCQRSAQHQRCRPA